MSPFDAPFVIYTLHFDPSCGRFQHYVGSARTDRLPARLHAHAHGYGASLTSRAAHRRCTLILVHLEPAETRDVERRIKRRGHFDKRCFLCNPALAEPPYVADLQPQLQLFEVPKWQPFACSLG